MAFFLTRIELHSATVDNYYQLHLAMAKKGFLRTIASTNGCTYDLPTAEYSIAGSFSIETVLEAAKQAATSTGKSYEAITVECAQTLFFGLPISK